MSAKQKPSDLDATPQATEDHERLIATYERACRERGLLVNLKRKAKGEEKQYLARKILGVELVLQPALHERY